MHSTAPRPPEAAPPPAPPAPPARRSVAGTIAIALAVLVGVAGIGGIVTVIVLAATGHQSDAPSPERSREPGFVPAPLAPSADDGEIVRVLRGGTCRRNDVERTKTRYLTAMRARGAAGQLRGKVAIVHFKLTMPGTSWTATSSQALTRTARATRAYLLEQAKRWNVPDLAIDAIEWPLTLDAPLPELRLGTDKKPSTADGDAFRKATRRAIEGAVGRPMARVVDDVMARGYANVAFLVSLPSGPRGIRDFAAPTGAPGDAAELAYVLEPDWNVQSRSLLATHELLHLFGADDLYEVRGVPGDEANDIMNAECDGLGSTLIGETSAWAIGWTAQPRRSFAFSDR